MEKKITKTQNQNQKYNQMEIKNFHSQFYVIIFTVILLFLVILYLGYDDMKNRQASGEDVIGNNRRKWMKRFQKKNPYLNEQDEIENFKDTKKEEENAEEKDTKKETPDILEIDEEEDKKNDKNREGAKDIFKEIGKFFKKIGDFFKKFPKMMSGLLKKAGDAVKKGIITPMTKFFGKIIGPILDIGDAVECGIHKIENIFTCSKWYLLQLLGIILYFPYHILFYITGFTRFEDMMWSYVNYGDRLFYNYTGYHFAHYQDDVVNLCYICCKK